jgi:hypothetical protein
MSDPGNGGAVGEGAGQGLDEGPDEAGRWVRWHQAYEDPDSPLSARLRLVQSGVRAVLDHHPPGPIRLVSICAGQGRDVIDVVAGHPRQADVRARLVEFDPTLVAFARARAAAAGVGDLIKVVQGDASRAGSYAGALPADLVLICGVFGNISDEDIRATVLAMPSFCAPGGPVVWTRHRRPPDLTPSIREWFGQAGFAEQSFVAPEPYVLCVGSHQWVGGADAGGADAGGANADTLDPDLRLFAFVGDGSLPA